MTLEAGGKQYVAIMSGLNQISKGGLILTPELREMRNQTMHLCFRCEQCSYFSLECGQSQSYPLGPQHVARPFQIRGAMV
jgi:hypothetical protein